MLRPVVLSLAVAGAIAAPFAFANEAAPAPARAAEAAVERLLSMSVDGRIVIEADGSVRDYSLLTKLTPNLAQMLGKSIQSWRFEPVLIDGQARRVEARVRVSLAAHKDGEDYQVKVDNVVFPATPGAVELPAPQPAVEVTRRKMNPPLYPGGLMRAGVSARVLIALHFSPEGRVLEVVPVQTMLFDTAGNDAILGKAVEQFEAATLEAASKWTVNVKLHPGRPTNAKDFTAYTNVEYVMTQNAFGKRHLPVREKDGKWRVVARSGLRPLPWLSGLDAPTVGVADVDNGEMLPLAGTPRLMTPVAGTTL